MNKRDKRGLNQIVTSIILIVLIFVAVASVWVVFREVTEDVEEMIYETPEGVEIPKSNVEGCLAVWECGEWSDCSPTYGLESILSNDVFLKEEQHRECRDTEGCFYNKIVKQECDRFKGVAVDKVVKCGGEYIEIYDSDRVVSRLELIDSGLNIQIILGEVAYCDHCYNNKLDDDLGEVGIDCVEESYGICPKCDTSLYVVKYDYSLMVVLVIFFVVVAYLVLFKKHHHKHRERKKKVKKKQVRKKREKKVKKKKVRKRKTKTRKKSKEKK